MTINLKRICTLMLALAMMFTFMPTSVFADEDDNIYVYLERSTLYKGENVTLDFISDDYDDITYGDIVVEEHVYNEEIDDYESTEISEGYSVDETSITIDTEKLSAGIDYYYYIQGNGYVDGEIVGYFGTSFQIKNPKEYYFYENYIEMYLGETYTFNKDNIATVFNADYPDGEEVDFTITDVKSCDSNLKVEAKDDSWDVTSLELGSEDGSCVEVTYEDIHGETQIQEIRFDISKDELFLEVLPEEPDPVRPGNSIEITADAYIESAAGKSSEGFVYEWTFDNEEDFEYVTLTPNGNKATISIGEEETSEEIINVDIRVYHKDDPDRDATSGVNIEINYDPFGFDFGEMPENLGVNESFTYTPEMIVYNNTIFPITVFYGFEYDDTEFEILDKDNNEIESGKNYSNSEPFTIKRLTSEEAYIDIHGSCFKGEECLYYADDYFEFDEYHVHDLEKVDEVEATCGSNGTKEYWRCTGCGKIFADENGETEIEDPEVIPALDHDLMKIDEVAATCESDGTKAYWTCSECGKMFADENGETEIEEPEVIPALGHKLVKTDEVAATCESDGTKAYWTCSECGKMFSDENGETEIEEPEVVKAFGHKLEKVEAKAATKTEEGWAEHWKCSECGKLFADAEGTKETTEDEIRIAKLPETEADDTVKVGDAVSVGGNKYVVTAAGKVALTKAKNKKSVTVPATVNVKGVTYKVTAINAKAFKGSKIRTVTVGKNVSKIAANAFNGSKAKQVTVKSKSLTKSNVKGCFKKSKVTTVKVNVGTKKANKSYVKKYKKVFTKKVTGKKVTVK